MLYQQLTLIHIKATIKDISTKDKKVTNEKLTSKNQCNCRKNDCPIDGNCQASDIIK